jgi:hypothetical protein
MARTSWLRLTRSGNNILVEQAARPRVVGVLVRVDEVRHGVAGAVRCGDFIHR